MIQRLVKVVAVAATLAFTVGCSAQPDAESSEGGAPSLPSKTSSATRDAGTPEANERGYFPKKLGEPAGIGPGMDSPESATFTIDSVQIDPPCDQYGIRPESGHTLLLDVRVATGNHAGYANNVSLLLSGSFVEIGTDGVTHAAQIGMCTDHNDLITNVPTFGTNQKYRGTVEIVVPEASGTLALQAPADGLTNGAGWEWTYPTN